MKRTILILTALVMLALAGSSRATPIRNCGNLPDTFNGYQSVVNVTSRVVSCPKARNTARGIMWTMIGRGDDNSQQEDPGPASFVFHWTGWIVRGSWHTTYVQGYFEGYWADVRATAAHGWVVHFQVRGE